MRDPAHEILSAFARSVTTPSSWPAGVRVARGDVASRFAVYRNNVAVARIGAFADLFPVTRRLVGEAFFQAVVRAHLDEAPPRNPVMATWGDGFVSWLERHPKTSDIGWLVGVARLEAAWMAAYHAAEAEPWRTDELAGVPLPQLLASRVEFHPSLRIVASDHPIGSIWSAHQGTEDPGPIEGAGPEIVLVVRPRAEVLVRVIGEVERLLLERLSEGLSIAAAGEAASTADPAFDVGGALVALGSLGAITALHG